MRSPFSSSSQTGTAVPAGVTFRVKAGIDAQRSPRAPVTIPARRSPADTMRTGNGRTLDDRSQARCS
jgi:hypothetical protein